MAHSDTTKTGQNSGSNLTSCCWLYVVSKKVMLTVATVAKVSSPSFFLRTLNSPVSRKPQCLFCFSSQFLVCTTAVVYICMKVMAVGTEKLTAPFFYFNIFHQFPVLQLCPMFIPPCF